MARPRQAQKRRTRLAILDTAAAMLDQAQPATMVEVAQRAGVSRATLYRFFPSLEALLTEAALHVQARALDDQGTPDLKGTPEERVDALVVGVLTLVRDNDAAFRTMLRWHLAPRPAAEGAHAPPRGARRVRWLDAALEPLRDDLSAERYEQLKSALSALLGIEAWIAWRDVRALDADEAIAVARWMARALVQEARRSPR